MGAVVRRLLALWLAGVFAVHAAAQAVDAKPANQSVKASTTLNANGERVVRVETTLATSPEATWAWFATEPGLSCWAAPLVKLDLRSGGSLQTNYDKAAGIGGPGTITLGILNVVDAELLTFKVRLTEAFPAALRAQDERLQEVIQLQRLPNGGTRVVSTMVGWGTGPEWDKLLGFFVKGNEWSYRKLAECVAKGP